MPVGDGPSDFLTQKGGQRIGREPQSAEVEPKQEGAFRPGNVPVNVETLNYGGVASPEP